MKAFVLCGGLGSRLRPFTYSRPKTSMPFLNLPLLAYGWFYLEQLGVSHFICNSYLFPEKLKSNLESLKREDQQTLVVHEKKMLISGGGFYNVKNFFKEEKHCVYFNGDSLFFPSRLSLLQDFKEDFQKSSFEGSLFGIATPTIDEKRQYLWVDKASILREIDSSTNLLKKGFVLKNSKNLKEGELRPIQFTGLALFSQKFLETLSPTKHHIFLDVMGPHFKEARYKMFVDEEGLLLEGGEKGPYLEATEFCLKALFAKDTSAIAKETRRILEAVFKRFDPQDQQVGLKQSQKLSQQAGALILTPSLLKNQKDLKVEGFAVLGSQVSFIGKSFLKNVVLGHRISWRGELKNKTLLLTT